MTTEEILILAGVVVLVLVVLGLAAWIVARRKNKRQQRLRQRYGREYDEAVDSKGKRAGEDDLAHREEERRDLTLRDPGEPVRADLRQRMAELQFRFVEEPQEVLLEVQRVVVDALRARGYPVAEGQERALRLLSVDHPDETPPLRALLSGNYSQEIGNQRRLFLDARSALLAVMDVSYSHRDLSAAGGGPGSDRQPEPRGEARPDRDRDGDRVTQEPRPAPSSGQSAPGAYGDVGAPGPNERRT